MTGEAYAIIIIIDMQKFSLQFAIQQRRHILVGKTEINCADKTKI